MGFPIPDPGVGPIVSTKRGQVIEMQSEPYPGKSTFQQREYVPNEELP